MSHENVETLRRAYNAYNRGDIDAAVADVSPDSEYVPIGAVPGIRDPLPGPEGYKQILAPGIGRLGHAPLAGTLSCGDESSLTSAGY
jgi:ketosteroid isomerase-like protein